jgi:hypothetical protein
MKRIFIILVILLSAGMTVFAQSPDVSYYTQEINRSDATIFEILDVLKMVRDENLTGIGEFYNNAIRVFIRRLPNFSGNNDRLAVEEASRLLFRGLTAEKHAAAGASIWYLVRYFDIAAPQNDGYLMYEGIVSLGQIGAKDYASHISVLLEGYNLRTTTPDILVRGRIQRVVPGIIIALEALLEPVGVRPVFFASIGWYDNEINAIAARSLQVMMDAIPTVIGDIINGIIKDPFNNVNVKNAAWRELLRTQVDNEVKAKVAISVLEESYSFATSNFETRSLLRNMRISAIETINAMGIEDNVVYAYLERAYREAHDSVNTDLEVILLVLKTLSNAKTDEAVDLLTEFLRQLHSRRRSGSWGTVERDLLNVILPAIANTGTKATPTIQLLTIMSRSTLYTNAEQAWARNALTTLGQ